MGTGGAPPIPMRSIDPPTRGDVFPQIAAKGWIIDRRLRRQAFHEVRERIDRRTRQLGAHHSPVDRPTSVEVEVGRDPGECATRVKLLVYHDWTESGIKITSRIRPAHSSLHNAGTDGTRGRDDTGIRVLTVIITIFPVDIDCYGGTDGTTPLPSRVGLGVECKKS